MQNLEEYARELVNISLSDEEPPILHTPTRFSTNCLPSIQEKISPINKKSNLKPAAPKSAKKQSKSNASSAPLEQVTLPKSAKDKTKQMKETVEQQEK